MSLPSTMQPRIAFTLFTGNTVGRILMARPADRAQSAMFFFLVGDFHRHGVFAAGIDARIDGIEDAADQDRPPHDVSAELFAMGWMLWKAR